MATPFTAAFAHSTLASFLVFALKEAPSSVVVPFMALLWLIGCGLVLFLPRIAAIVFATAALVGVTDVRDVALWVGVSLVLAGLSLFAWVNRQRAARPAHLAR